MLKSKLASGLTAAFFGATILSGLCILSFAAPIAHAQPFQGCQQMSNSFGATPNNFKSKLNNTQEKQWIANKCKTTPCAYAPTCVAPKPPPKPAPVIAPKPAPVIAPAPAPVKPAPAPVQAAVPFMGCQKMSDTLGVNAHDYTNSKWGRATVAQQQQFTANNCNSRPCDYAPTCVKPVAAPVIVRPDVIVKGPASPALKCKSAGGFDIACPPVDNSTLGIMVAEGIKKVDLHEKNTVLQIDKDRQAMLIKIKKEEKNNDMMGRRMASVNEIAARETTNLLLLAEQRRKCFKTEKRDNCFERP